MRIDNDVKLDFNDVLIRPKRSTLTSRKNVDLERTFTFMHSGRTWTGVPVVAANMDTTGTFEMARALAEHRMITALHKHYSVEELKVGAELFSGIELTNDKATKDRFFQTAADYDILHISTHAGKNSGENNDAWMVFSDTKSSDHRLVATELLKLDLPASLVVLNACETGSGTVFKGEGPMSLARGFLDAGSQSTITNLWLFIILDYC